MLDRSGFIDSRWWKSASALVGAGALVLVGAPSAGAGGAPAPMPQKPAAVPVNSGCASGNVMNIVAHQDDDLLFLNPDLLRDIHSGKRVRTVFVTAGDAADRIGGSAAKRRKYWMERETGSKNAYAVMVGVKSSWTQSHLTVTGHRVVLFTLRTDPKISLVYLRLPDGSPDGSGAKLDHEKSLEKLRADRIRTIGALDGSATYTKGGLLATAEGLVNGFAPCVIRAQDYVTGDFGLVGDHSDHTNTAYLAHAASDAYKKAHSFVGYIDYAIQSRPENVKGKDLATKIAAWNAYDRHDSELPCYTAALRNKNDSCDAYSIWLRREYKVTTGPGWYQQCLVPDVSGTAMAAAGEAIRAQGCSVGTVTSKHDSSTAFGAVLSQSPEAKPVFRAQGTRVNLVISSGP